MLAPFLHMLLYLSFNKQLGTSLSSPSQDNPEKVGVPNCVERIGLQSFLSGSSVKQNNDTFPGKLWFSQGQDECVQRETFK